MRRCCLAILYLLCSSFLWNRLFGDRSMTRSALLFQLDSYVRRQTECFRWFVLSFLAVFGSDVIPWLIPLHWVGVLESLVENSDDFSRHMNDQESVNHPRLKMPSDDIETFFPTERLQESSLNSRLWIEQLLGNYIISWIFTLFVYCDFGKQGELSHGIELLRRRCGFWGALS